MKKPISVQGLTQFFKSVAHEFTETLSLYKNIAFAGFIPGVYKGYRKGKEEGEVSWGKAARNVAIDFADDLVMFGASSIVEKFPALNKYKGLERIQSVL